MTSNNSENDSEIVQNRSEIVFMYDARDTNPNGNPQSADNEPRIDRNTGQSVVTDVRLKRYIRDQLYQDGYNILIKSPTQLYKNPKNKAPTRQELVTDILEDIDDDADNEEIYEAFVNNATDVRYFGATLAIDDLENIPRSITGALQFTHGRSLNPVTKNVESKGLTTVIASGEDKKQGTLATDNRIHYALLSFGGVLNENAGQVTNLTKEDVKRLDDLLWKSLLNQTTTRSKIGQYPRLYCRVEYNENNYHIGGLESSFDMNSDKQLDMVRNPSEYTVNADLFVNQILENKDKINKIVLRIDSQMQFEYNNEFYNGDEFTNLFDSVEVKNL